jgi:hypothetical protein
MEHRILSERAVGDCRVRTCSCGEKYLFIGRACLRMDAERLGRLAELMSGRAPAPVPAFPSAVGEMAPWKGPRAGKEPCFN